MRARPRGTTLLLLVAWGGSVVLVVACGESALWTTGDGGVRDAGSTDAATPTDGGWVDGSADGGSPWDGVPEVHCSLVAHDREALEAALAQATAGDTVCLADGEWPDLVLAIDADGTADAPVTVAAEHPGFAILTGITGARMSGSHVVVTGLVFRDGQTDGHHLLDFRGASRVCSDCRLSNVAVVAIADETDTKWVSIRGERNRVDHCAFVGKESPGSLLVVWRPDHGANHHRIDHNYFADRPPLGENGGEAIRIGTSDHHTSSSHTVVEDNFFYQMSGEIEIISNKSGHNTYRHNVFVECAGLLTLRHGDDALVDGNVFLAGGGNGGGIRVIGARHRIVNNYVEGCRTSSGVRGGIVLMQAEESPLPTGYQQVEDVVVAFNTLVDCDQSFVLGAGTGTLPPRRVVVANNLVDTRGEGRPVIREVVPLVDSTFAGNVVWGGDLGLSDESGFTRADPLLSRGAGGLMRPPNGSPVQGAASEGHGLGVEVDVDLDPRSAPFDVGADQITAAPTRLPVTAEGAGPTYPLGE